DHHGIALDRLAVDLDADRLACLLPDTGDPTEPQPRSLRLGHPDHRCGELPGMDLRGVLGRSQLLADGHVRRPPAKVVLAGAARKAGEAAIGVEPAIAPILNALLCQLRVQLEAAPRQRAEWRAVAPVARQEPAGFARRGAGDAGNFNHRRLDAAAA